MHCNCIAPLLGDRRRITKQSSGCFPGVRRQTGTKLFSVGDEKYWSTAAASAVSAACSMLAVRRQRKPCRRFVDVSAARRGRQTTKHAVQIERAHRQLTVSKSDVYIGVCRRNDLYRDFSTKKLNSTVCSALLKISYIPHLKCYTIL